MKKKITVDKVTLKKTVGRTIEAAGEALLWVGFGGLIPSKAFKYRHRKPNMNNIKR